MCPAHGVWFDNGELARIIEFVRSGGWERALAIEHAAHTAEVTKPVLPTDDRSATFGVTAASVGAALQMIANFFE